MFDYVAYLKTPKNASTTLLYYLEKYEKIHFFYSLEEFEDSILMKDEKVFIFTTVRNPYTRSVSSWQHCIRESWIDKDTSFDDFLNLDFTKRNSISWYSMPQRYFIGIHHQDKINDVFKVEELNERFKEIDPNCNIIEYHNPDLIKHPKLTKDQIKKINEVYKVDFETFNYKMYD